MKRDALTHLAQWVQDDDRKPLILRGARQVGKSYLASELGKSFDNFVEINFEATPSIGALFEGDIVIRDLVARLQVATNARIKAGRTLLFLDEIQCCPRALIALRYFYEAMPELHVIAAGSLIEFAIEKIGIPVGRVRSLYIYPMSFVEFLTATGNDPLREYLFSHPVSEMLDEVFHTRLLSLLKEYMIVGGMPEAVKVWVETKDYLRVKRIHRDLLDTYRQDFGKYGKKSQLKYLDKVFDSIPRQLGKKFVFARVDGSLKTRELRPALELLEKAQVARVVHHSSANGVPLGAEANDSLFKVIFIDVALTQALLGMDSSDILLHFDKIVNQGELVEAFVGQELMAYSDPHSSFRLHYWNREKVSSNAEVDYVVAKGSSIYPIEVKSGPSMRLKSLLQFLKEKETSVTGIHFSVNNFQRKSPIHRFPLYSVGVFIHAGNDDL